MKMKRTLQAAAIMAATGSCFLSSKEATLSLRALTADGEEVAGLELFVGGDVFPGLNARKFTATGLLADTSHWVVPDHGTATATARIFEDGRVVAEGIGEWGLEPEVEWILYISRGYSAVLHVVGVDPEDPKCPEGIPECHRVWRFPIVEDAANYENDALWMWVQRFRSGGCGWSLMCG
ncbi:MAG: hypothetical protein J4F34_06575 [Gemmatimonadetes bacterium]|nr:hypothetical protein [Gemmatimonadota bacterium]